MNMPRLITVPGFVRWGIRIDSAPAELWLGLQLAALWPTWLWIAQDMPIALAALPVLAAVTWRMRRELRASPRLGWLMLGMLGTIVAAAMPASTSPVLPALQALSCGWLAFAPTRLAGMPRAGLAAVLENTFTNRVCLKALFGAVMLLCVVGAGCAACM